MYKIAGFYYHMKLHYSQTEIVNTPSEKSFYYHMKLHYSQTSNSCGREYLVHYLTGQFHMQYFKL